MVWWLWVGHVCLWWPGKAITRPLPGQFVILRGNMVNDARTRDLQIWAYI